MRRTKTDRLTHTQNLKRKNRTTFFLCPFFFFSQRERENKEKNLTKRKKKTVRMLSMLKVDTLWILLHIRKLNESIYISISINVS